MGKTPWTGNFATFHSRHFSGGEKQLLRPIPPLSMQSSYLRPFLLKRVRGTSRGTELRETEPIAAHPSVPGVAQHELTERLQVFS
jgi:hypothetical protein